MSHTRPTQSAPPFRPVMIVLNAQNDELIHYTAGKARAEARAQELGRATTNCSLCRESAVDRGRNPKARGITSQVAKLVSKDGG